MSATYHSLSSGDFAQNWTDIGLITADDNWSGVPSIIGYRGDDLTAATGVDPQTVVADGTATPVDVIANQTSTSITTGGVAEFELANPTIAMQGSGTADAPFLLIHLDSTGRKDVTVNFNLRDIDGSADNTNQQVAVQYRVGASGDWTNVPAGYVADASTGPNLATLVTPVSVTLPAGANNAGQLQVRIITTNAASGDEWIGVDDIVVSSAPGDVAPPTNVFGGITILDQAESLQGSVDTPVATNSLTEFNRIGSYNSGDSEGGAESIAFDASNARAYVTNAASERIDILDLSNPSAPTKVGSIDLVATLTGFNYGNVNSVAVRDGLVAVAVQNADGGENGVVALYDGAGTLIKTIEVGVLPDQLTFSPDGSLLTVANEGERYLDLSGEATVENAPGTITIISIPADPADAAVRNTIGFSALDAFEAQIDALGIKTLDAKTIPIESGAITGTIAIPDSTASQDIEPEYVAISADGTKAYVTLQEVNAVAVIDLTDASADKPVSLLPLGYVDFSLPGNEADFSDRDGPGNTASISVGNAPVKGLLQPDAIASFDVAGTTYFITANEGDSRILQSPTFEDPALNEARASTLTDPDNPDYARVNVDTVWSSASDLYSFGGRGFSIFRQNDDGTIDKVEETGGDVEQIIAALPNAAAIFNGENGGGFDSRSDNKGAEPEGVAVGEVDGTLYAFVALERVGGVMVWDISNPTDAKFVRYMAPTSQDYGPEVIKFVSAEESPTGKALVLTANEISGTVTVYEASGLTKINEIQGTGASSAKVGQTVTVEAIVVGDFQNGDTDTARNLGGFYLQEELVDQDGNPLSSEGIFISAASLGPDVKIGDRVRVTGTVAESFGNTEINATSVTIVEAGAVADVNTMAVDVDLPTAGVQGSNGSYRADLEAYEGMLVTFPETLTISEQFNYDQFGEIRLTQGGRPDSYTVNNDPSVSGYDAHLKDIASRSIIFDDGRSTSNPNLDNVITDGVYNSSTAPRMGDTITGLTGVLDYDFSQFRVHAIENGPGVNDVVQQNPRPTSAPDVGGTLKVASLNVLNYFVTLDNGSLTANGMEPRGAETTAEFDRQTNKLVNTILTLDADVLGLMEMENNFIEGSSGNAFQYLVDKLNSTYGSFKYDWVRPGQNFVGGDAIAVGFIYDVTSVKVSFGTEIAILDDSDLSADFLAQSTLGHVFNGLNTSRAAIAVTFEEIATGGEFTAVANHFKSKSGSGTGVDADIKDGNGGWNNQRTLAAEALKDWIATDPTKSGDSDVVILGDLNAYNKEDPIDVLVNAGYTDQAADGYSYVFDGQKGSLDHMLTNGSMSSQVTGVADWHINADEADALDYQLNFNSDLSTNERDPAIFDANVIARESDHDPVVLGLDLTEEPNKAPVADNEALTIRINETLTLDPRFLLVGDSDLDGDTLTVTSVNGAVNGSVAVINGQVVFTATVGFTGVASFDYTVTDGGLSDTGTVFVTVSPSAGGSGGADTLMAVAAGGDLAGLGGADRLQGKDGVDVMSGGDGADLLYGLGGADALFGDGGNDVLSGGAGADSMWGGAGNDSYIIDNLGDVVDETNVDGTDAGGVDSVQSSVNFVLGAYVERLTLTGSADVDGTGNNLDNIIYGNAGTNSLSGGDGKDALLGGLGDDFLFGGAGNDHIVGGAGADQASGGSGADAFTFTKADLAHINVGDAFDMIMDFEGAGNGYRTSEDTITFTGFSAASTLTRIGDVAGHPEQHLYEVADGAFKAQLIVQYAGSSNLKSGDFIFYA